MGSVASQASFVAILNGAGVGGGAFFVAMLLAAVLMFTYVFSYLELSLMMPKAGGPGTYTTVASGHFAAIILVLAGYLASAVFGGLAELMLLDRILDSVFPGVFSNVALGIVVVLTVLNVLGINIFATVQNVIVFGLLASALLIGFAGLNGDAAQGLAPVVLWRQFGHADGSIFTLMVLALWAFAGLEYVCPLVEEARQPQKTLPNAMLIAAAVLVIVYGLIAYAGMRQVPHAALAASEVPHWLLVKALFGKAGVFVMVVFAVTASASITNTAIAGVARMLYGMAHHHQLPPIFKKIHPRWDTPWVGILVYPVLVAIPLIIFNKAPGYLLMLIISASALWLIAYVIAFINVMVLRKRYSAFKRPFKTPLYPLPQIIGIAGMGYAILNNSPAWQMTKSVYLNAGLVITVFAVYAFFWVKFKMKKGIFEAEPIEEAIAD